MRLPIFRRIIFIAFIFLSHLSFGQASGKVISNKPSGGTISLDTINAFSLLNVKQTTAGQTITLANMTSGGKLIYVRNVGSVDVIISPGTSTISPGYGLLLGWTGLTWNVTGKPGGASGDFLLRNGSLPMTGDFDMDGNSFQNVGGINLNDGALLNWGGTILSSTGGAVTFSADAFSFDASSGTTITNGLTISNVTAGKAIYVDGSKIVRSSSTTSTQLGYLSNVSGDVQGQIDAKQATLVSATNIKTVNGSSLLGSGNLVVSGTIADADYGDVAVSSSGTVWTVQSATSPAITTSLTTPSTTFSLANSTATTVNFAGGASTALNIGNASGTNTVLGATSFSQGVTLAAATTDITSTLVNLNGATSNLKVTTGGVTMLLSTGGGATVNNGITFGRGSSMSNTTGTNRLALASATWAPTSGAGNFHGFASNATINQTSTASGVATLYECNPTLTSVTGTVYGYRSQLASGPTGGGTAWNFYADGTAANGFGGDIKLLTAGNGLYIKEGTNATMGVATLSGGAVTVNTTKVTANSRVHLTIQSLGTVSVPKAIGVTSRSAGTSFVITSADATDTSVIAWVIVEPN
jgi:hypothetical protein